jgi:hypothetical protein
MDLEEKRASLHKKGLEILASVSEMEKSGASESEIEAKIQEANKIIEQSGSLSSLIDAMHRKRMAKIRALIAITFLGLVGTVALQFYN